MGVRRVQVKLPKPSAAKIEPAKLSSEERRASTNDTDKIYLKPR